MPELFSVSYRARWADMDFNQHMRNAAFLGCSEETRVRFLDASGWTMARFHTLQIGPVVLEDKLTYKHELRLLEPFHVDLAVSAITDDARRMKVRNRFFRDSDGALAATVESVALWFDLATRQPVVPPDDLRDLWLSIPRTDDFESWPTRR